MLHLVLLFAGSLTLVESSVSEGLPFADYRNECLSQTFQDLFRHSTDFPDTPSEPELATRPDLPNARDPTTFDEPISSHNQSINDDSKERDKDFLALLHLRRRLSPSRHHQCRRSNQYLRSKSTLKRKILDTGEDVIKSKGLADTLIGKQTNQEQLSDSDPPLPSFNEWTKQKLEEKQQQHDGQSKNGGTGSPTVGQPLQVVDTRHARNYASKECGAKVLQANSEAQHASAVLNEKELDEYMINPCNLEGPKWFIVELCETIQITRLDVANLELFSSSPKDFRFWVSERYPTSEWTFLGAWTAEDVRRVQNFQTDRRMYAKYLKVESISHYGSEHFCTLSLLRVLGVSVMEEYEAEAAQEQKRELTPPPVEMEAPPVGDVITMTTPETSDSSNAATQELGTAADKPNSKTQSTNFIAHQELLSNAKDVVVQMAKGVIGSVFGGTNQLQTPTTPSSAVNSTNCSSTSNDTIETAVVVHGWEDCLMCTVVPDTSRKACGYVRACLVTRRRNKLKKLEPSQPIIELTTANESLSTPAANFQQNFAEPTVTPPPEDESLTDIRKAAGMPLAETDAGASLPGVATSAKESVFARLNNRLRALETNISLSGEYLGELSLRYRKQMDEMQRALNRSATQLTEHMQATDKKLIRYRLEIERLQMELSSMRSAMVSMIQKRYENATNDIYVDKNLDQQWPRLLSLVAIVEMSVFFAAILFYRRRQSKNDLITDSNALEAAVQQQIRQMVQEELDKYLRKPTLLMANGSLLVEHRQQTPPPSPRADCKDLNVSNLSQEESCDLIDRVVLDLNTQKENEFRFDGKAKKKPKKKNRHLLKDQFNNKNVFKRKTSEASAHERRRDNSSRILDDSSAGILFSSSRIMNKNRRKETETKEQLYRYDIDPSWRKFGSQNAFDLLCSSPSRNETYEKVARFGRGPS